MKLFAPFIGWASLQTRMDDKIWLLTRILEIPFTATIPPSRMLTAEKSDKVMTIYVYTHHSNANVSPKMTFRRKNLAKDSKTG